MYRTAIVGNTSYYLFVWKMVSNLILSNTASFWMSHSTPWWKKQPLKTRRSMMFIHNNAPAHAAHEA